MFKFFKIEFLFLVLMAFLLKFGLIEFWNLEVITTLCDLTTAKLYNGKITSYFPWHMQI